MTTVDPTREHDLTVVVPTYNEAESLPVVLPKLLEHCSARGWQVVVVDDGSTDGTADILRGFDSHPSLRIVHNKVNRGYGGALKSGIANAETELVVTIDADGQHHLDDIDRLVDVLRERDADMVIGSRRGQKGASLYRELGKRVIRAVARMMMPVPVHDINSGFKVYRTQLAQIIMTLCPDTMAFSDLMTLSFVNARLRVVEVPISISQRIGGRSTVTTRAALQTVQALVNVTMLFRPFRVYFPFAVAFFALGAIWGSWILLAGRGVSVGATLAIVTGQMLLFLGLIGEQIAALRRDPVDREIRRLDKVTGPRQARALVDRDPAVPPDRAGDTLGGERSGSRLGALPDVGGESIPPSTRG